MLCTMLTSQGACNDANDSGADLPQPCKTSVSHAHVTTLGQITSYVHVTTFKQLHVMYMYQPSSNHTSRTRYNCHTTHNPYPTRHAHATPLQRTHISQQQTAHTRSTGKHMQTHASTCKHTHIHHTHTPCGSMLSIVIDTGRDFDAATHTTDVGDEMAG